MFPNFLICEKGAKHPLSSYKHAIKYTPGEANVESTHRIDSIIPLESLEIILGEEPEVFAPFSLFKRGVSSLTTSSLPESASGLSADPSIVSLNDTSSLEPRRDSFPVADASMFPYEFEREGDGDGGGETRAERIFKEFILC